MLQDRRTPRDEKGKSTPAHNRYFHTTFANATRTFTVDCGMEVTPLQLDNSAPGVEKQPRIIKMGNMNVFLIKRSYINPTQQPKIVFLTLISNGSANSGIELLLQS